MSALEMIFEKINPERDDSKIEPGEGEQQPPQDAGTLACAALQDDIDGKLFEAVEKTPHRWFFKLSPS